MWPELDNLNCSESANLLAHGRLQRRHELRTWSTCALRPVQSSLEAISQHKSNMKRPFMAPQLKSMAHAFRLRVEHSLDLVITNALLTFISLSSRANCHACVLWKLARPWIIHFHLVMLHYRVSHAALAVHMFAAIPVFTYGFSLLLQCYRTCYLQSKLKSVGKLPFQQASRLAG